MASYRYGAAEVSYNPVYHHHQNLDAHLHAYALLAGELGGWPSLQYLDLSHSYISSTLPAAWGQAFNSLEVLRMEDNAIFGTLPKGKLRVRVRVQVWVLVRVCACACLCLLVRARECICDMHLDIWT